ncbi:MAG: LamG domain-containing protein [Selenomonadaceae bacterium]|nr:LamG domain-containing protein [Selenomonadaceae bacterium]
MSTSLNYLKVWLKFDKSVTDDFCGNNWTTYGNPTLGTANAINGKALQLDGNSYIKLSNLPLGGQSFYIDGWVNVDSSSPNNARIIHIVNSSGFALLSLRKSATDSTKLDFWANSYANVSVDNGYTRTATHTSIGQRVHFKLLYRYDRNFLSLYINDVWSCEYSAGYGASAPKYNRQNFDIYIGALPNGNQAVIGSIDEIRIYDNAWLVSGNNNPPTADEYLTTVLIQNFDLLRKIKNPPLTWRYENYGTADLLTIAGTTVTGLDSTQSKTGSAFYQPTRSKCFDIPATKEIWIKCDIYTTANYTDGDRIRIYSGDSNGVNGFSSSETINNNLLLWHNGTSQSNITGFAKNKNRSFLLHMISNATNGVVECFLPSGATDKFVGNVNGGDDFANVYIQMDGSNILVSNLIISNAPVDIDEEVKLSFIETTDYDLQRNIVNVETKNIDLQREIVKTENIAVDVVRNVQKIVESEYDLERNITDGDKVIEILNVDLQRNVTKTIQNDYDIIRDTSEWRYENAGTAELLKVSGNNLTGLDSSKSKTGIAFWQNQRVAIFPIPATKEIWVKFDLYYGGTAQWRAYDRLDGKDTGVGRYQQINSLTSFINGPLEYTLNPKNTITANQLHTFLLHMVSDSTNGIVELWVDGEKYYSDDFAEEGLIYRGNVENGNDFSNFYLQSQNNSNYFSNIIISNAPIGIDENVIGYGLTSSFAFDLQREVKNFVTSENDLIRNVIKEVEILNDVERNVIKSVTENYDLQREIENVWRYENYGTADLLTTSGTTVELSTGTDAYGNMISKYGSGFYQPNREKCFDIPATKEIWIKCDILFTENYSSSDRIRIYHDGVSGVCGFCDFGYRVETIAIWHNGIKCKDNPNSSTTYFGKYPYSNMMLHMKSDTENGIVEFLGYDYDGESHLYATYTGNVNNGDDFDNVYIQMESTNIIVSNLIISNREIQYYENAKMDFSALYDLTRQVVRVTKIIEDYDLQRTIFRSQTLLADTSREVANNVNEEYDTCRNVTKTFEIDFDTTRSLPHEVIMSTIENIGDEPTEENDTEGLQSIEINLSEQQLTDRLNFVTVNDVEILDDVQGQYLDYKYSMRIEEMTEQNILKSCQCCVDNDELLYKTLSYKIPKNEQWHRSNQQSQQQQELPEMAAASKHLENIAEALGKQAIIQFDDFISTVDVDSGGVTFADLIRDIFGWTSRLPHMMINCYFRDDKLFAVQRGYEENLINLTNLTTNLTRRDKKIIRTVWSGGTPTSQTEVRPGYYWYLKPIDRKASEGNNNYKYNEDGLISSTTVKGKDSGSWTTTNYFYTTLKNGKKFLSIEETTVYENNIQVDYQVIQHTPLDQGQEHIIAKDEEGDYLGSVVGRSKGDDRILHGPIRDFEAVNVNYQMQRTLYGLSLIDTTFPIHGDEKLAELTDRINWLNRKVQEEITLDIYDYNHVIDFNDRLTYNGNFYYLRNNTAIKTPLIVNKQTISMVRWY